jgi:hypothetical protein
MPFRLKLSIDEVLDGVAAERGGNDRRELRFVTQECRAIGRSRARVAGMVIHEGLSNEPATGEAYPAARTGRFEEEWRRIGGDWRIVSWRIDPLDRAP